MSVLIAVLLVSAQAAAEPQSTAVPPAATSATAAKPEKKKLVCKVDEADSGTRMARRVCRTAEEWNQRPQIGTSRSGFSISGEAMQSQ
jgi:hypothetical protein